MQACYFEPTEITCIHCKPGCLFCNSMEDCVTCDNDRKFDTNGECVCKEGYSEYTQ